MITINLSVVDRLQIHTFLPKSGGMVEMEIAKSITDRVRFSIKEIEDFEMKDGGDGSVSWNLKKEVPLTVALEDSEYQLLLKGVDMSDASKVITNQNFDLAKKIRNIKKA